MEDGYIKYYCNWIQAEPLMLNELNEIIFWRDRLFALGFIGVYQNGIGFGNVSVRLNGYEFLITGSSTGHFEHINKQHIVLVTNYDLKNNSLTCKGPIKASSESLSHAVIYESSLETFAVIHVHHKPTWEKLMDRVPTTFPEASYGTPEMAEEIKRLFRETDVSTTKIIVMGGHEEGIITFGTTLEEAARILIENS
jgi:ribulose-5-phosphate 4-epimerase/fuculose-1-phosphate aldolase